MTPMSDPSTFSILESQAIAKVNNLLYRLSAGVKTCAPKI